MHILIIPAEHYLTPKTPLGGIFQQHQARALSAAGYKVGVISSGTISPRLLFKSYPYHKYEQDGEISVYRNYSQAILPGKLRQATLFNNKQIKLGLALFDAYVADNGLPDIVHAHNALYAGLIAAEIKSRYGIPFVITEHSTAYARGCYGQDELLTIQQIFDEAAVISTVSTPFKLLLNTMFSDRHYNIDVLFNILDDYFANVNVKEKNKSQFVFTNIASCDEKKDQLSLLKAFALSFKGMNVRLRIGGVGPLKQALIDMAVSEGIAGQVDFLGLLSRQQVKEEMIKSNCFVLSSRYETFGVVLIEAAACGTPMVATKCGGPEDIVNELNGILVQPSDSGVLADAMKNLYNNYQRYNPEEIASDCLQRFGADAFIRKVSSLYERVI